MKQLIFIIKYLKYRIKAKTKYDIHSPFVFELITKVFYNKKSDNDIRSIEAIRKQLLKNKTIVTFEEMGAGSLLSDSKTKNVSNITLNSAKHPKYAQLLYRIVNHFKPANILELGTSMGISSAYMAKANTKANLTTIEGSEKIAAFARENFNQLNINNIRQIIGNFDNKLPELLKEKCIYDFIFFDGNHRKTPTLNYFYQCLKNKNDNSIFVFDDIHWSQEMEEAWNEIKQSEEVTITIDLFFLGIVFFRKESSKEHFTIKF